MQDCTLSAYQRAPMKEKSEDFYHVKRDADSYEVIVTEKR